jgi:KDO2-lipid IV(A) lauroyltransferase
VEFREVARPPHDENGHQIIERYARLAEQSIRSEPESWLWSNRRWKRQPPPTVAT